MYIRISEYVKKYGIPRGTVYRWIREKRLKAEIILIERVRVEDKNVVKKPRHKLPPRYKKLVHSLIARAKD